MKLNIYAALAALLLILSLQSASALSLIADCQYQEYRDNQSEIIFTGTVVEIDQNRDHSIITFSVNESIKGPEQEEIQLYQQGNVKTGTEVIPGLTLDWETGDAYRINARSTTLFGEGEERLQLVCAGMGRELIDTQAEIVVEPIACRDIQAVALNPETNETVDFNSECNVPRGWTLITRNAQPEIQCSALPVMAMNKHGERQQFDSECDVPRDWSILAKAVASPEPEICAQVITYAKNPQTGDVKEFPTPCDVPKGWEKTEEPQPVKEPKEESKPVRSGIFGRIAIWLGGLF